MTFGLQDIPLITPVRCGQDMMIIQNCHPVITVPIIRTYGVKLCRGSTKARQILISRCRQLCQKPQSAARRACFQTITAQPSQSILKRMRYQRNGVMSTPTKYTRLRLRKTTSRLTHLRIHLQTIRLIRRRIITAIHQRIIPVIPPRIHPEAIHQRTILIRPILRTRRIRPTHRIRPTRLPLRAAERLNSL